MEIERLFFFFFFQAEDGIRDGTVTGVQTCALPILPPLVELCTRVKRRGGTLHLPGLIGNGGVHALDQHLVAAVRLAHQHELPVAIHAWLDGRDTPPQSALAFMQELVDLLAPYGGRAVVSTVVGRYYAMDRDKRWERTKIAYDAMVHGVGEVAPDPVTAIRRAYEAGETDEFVKPRVIAGTPRIRPGDGIFCFNYRADRMRQMVRALAVERFDGFDTGTRTPVDLVTMTQYDATFPFPMAFGPMVLSEIVARVLSDHGKTMFRTAETEKYAHVTYFFNGGVETPYPGEERLLVPLLLIDDGARGPLRHGGALCDVGPTLLRLLDIEPPPEMTGRDLRETD